MRAVAYIIDCNDNLIDGLQPASRSDDAIHVARRTAEETGSEVILVDSDGEWLVHPDGSCEEMHALDWVQRGLTPPAESEED